MSHKVAMLLSFSQTRPELQNIIFKEGYPAGTENHQDFKLCVDMTHVTYVLHHDAFINGGYTGSELENALDMHAYMGYNFYVSEVAAFESVMTREVDIAVTVTQSGVAPFYYDLGLALECADLSVPLKLPGVEAIIERGESRTFRFTGIPNTKSCLSAVSLKLDSSMAYPDRPVRFAQGSDGTVELEIPFPQPSAENGAAELVIPSSEEAILQENIHDPSSAYSISLSTLTQLLCAVCAIGCILAI